MFWFFFIFYRVSPYDYLHDREMNYFLEVQCDYKNHVFHEDLGESELKIGIDLSEVTKRGSYGYIRLSFDNYN